MSKKLILTIIQALCVAVFFVTFKYWIKEENDWLMVLSIVFFNGIIFTERLIMGEYIYE